MRVSVVDIFVCEEQFVLLLFCYYFYFWLFLVETKIQKGKNFNCTGTTQYTNKNKHDWAKETKTKIYIEDICRRCTIEIGDDVDEDGEEMQCQL